MKYRMLRGSDVIRKGDQYFTRSFVLEGEWLADSTSHGDKVSRWMNKGDIGKYRHPLKPKPRRRGK